MSKPCRGVGRCPASREEEGARQCSVRDGRRPAWSRVCLLSGAALWCTARAADRRSGRGGERPQILVLLAIVFKGIEFDDIVLGSGAGAEELEGIALGLVLGTAVAFSGVVLALGAILTPTKVNVPRDTSSSSPLRRSSWSCSRWPNDRVAEGVVADRLFARHRVRHRPGGQAGNADLPQLGGVRGVAEWTTGHSRPAAGGGCRRHDAVRHGAQAPRLAESRMAVGRARGIVIGAATVSTGTEGILEEYGPRAPYSVRHNHAV